MQDKNNHNFFRGIEWMHGMAFLSALLAMAQQSVWTRRMVDVMGGSAASTARVFGCFFLGIALGSAVAGVKAAQVKRPWRWLAAAEAGVALLSIPMLYLPLWTQHLWPWLGPDNIRGLQGSVLKTFLSILVVLPPALLMGFFLPFAVEIRSAAFPQQNHALRLYAWNTLGAVAGILVITCGLLPAWGLFGAMAAVIAGNLATSVFYLWMDAHTSPPKPAPTPLPSPSAAPRLSRNTLLLAALSGLLILALEIAALAAIHLAATLSIFAAPAMLASFITILALSGFTTDAWIRRGGNPSTLRARLPWLAGILLLTPPLLFHPMLRWFPLPAPTDSLLAFILRIFLFTSAVFGPALLAAGAWFPLLAAPADPKQPPPGSRAWGQLLAINGLGGFLGAEIAHRFLLPLLGPFTAIGMIAFIYLVIAWTQLPLALPFRQKSALLASFLLAGLLITCLFPALPTIHPRFRPHLISQHHGREGSLAIIDPPQIGLSLLLENQYILGSSGARQEQEQQAHLPLQLHPNPRRVAFLGGGTFISPGAALLHPSVAEIHVAEISHSVAQAARKHFGPFNHQVLDHPRTRTALEDARTWIAAHDQAFDVIISDLFLPWGPGEARLYSREHFLGVRRALRPEGLFCLWLPLYQLREHEVDLIVNTFQSVFPEGQFYLREEAPHAPVLGLVAGKARLPALRHDLHSPHLGTFGPRKALSAINTLDNLLLELQSSQARITQGESAPYLRGPRFQQWRQTHFPVPSPP